MSHEITSEFNAHLLHPVVFLTPENTKPSAWIGHIPFAYWIMNAAKPKKMVELGTHNGASYCAFLQATVHLGTSVEAYAVDTWQGDKHAGFYGEDTYQVLSEFHDSKYGSFSSLLRMTFEEAANKFHEGSIDLLHIDGLHTYEAVKNDFDTWLPKMSDSGIILFHDIQVRSADFGVWKLWAEIKDRYPSFSFTHSAGLGVLAVGKNQTPLIHWLTEQSKHTENTLLIRNLFSVLGDRFSESRQEIDRMKRAMEDSISWKLAMFIRKLATPFLRLPSLVRKHIG